MTLRSAVALAALMPLPAAADVPRVVADIAPVHSLVAQAMLDLGEPALLVRPEMSEHDHALRPSEARALADADLVVWVGPALTPWLADSVGSLVRGRSLELLDVAGTVRLGYRAPHGGDDHGHGHGHGEGGVDPHAWLDPENGRTWLDAIAAALAEIDRVQLGDTR